MHQISCIIRLTGQGSECTTLKHTVPGKCVLNYFWSKLVVSTRLLHPSERLECTRVPWLVHWELASSFQVGEMNSVQAWTLQEVNDFLHLWLACYTEFISQTWKLLQVDKECKCLCTADYLAVIIYNSLALARMCEFLCVCYPHTWFSYMSKVRHFIAAGMPIGLSLICRLFCLLFYSIILENSPYYSHNMPIILLFSSVTHICLCIMKIVTKQCHNYTMMHGIMTMHGLKSVEKY